CVDNSQQVLDLFYNESFGSVTLIKGLDEFFNPPGVTVNVGEVVRLIAEAAEGYYFMGWFDENGRLLTLNNDYSFTFTGESFLQANFIPNSAVATVGGVGYESLEEAVAEANAGETIVLLKDYELTESIVIP